MGGTWPFPPAICFSDQKTCQYLHMGTAGPAALGQHAQSLFGLSICKRRGCLSALASFLIIRHGGSLLLAVINGSNYEDKANTQCPSQWRVSSWPLNQVRTSAPPFSSVCLWVRLRTSCSLSYLIRKMGCMPLPHPPTPAFHRTISRRWCSVAGRGRSKPRPTTLRPPRCSRALLALIGAAWSDSAIFGRTRWARPD